MSHVRGAGIAAAGTLAGLGICASGAIYEDTSRALGGTVLTITALTITALAYIRSWVTDTSDERRNLAAAQHRVEEEERRYFALKAAIEGEHMRLTRDMAADRARTTAQLAAERTAMHAEFEEQRLQVAKEAFRTGVEMERAGMLKPETPTPANLIPFPGPAERAPERERSREHGVVGP